MRAAAFEHRKDDVDRLRPWHLLGVGQHLAHVIGVAKRDIAFAGGDGLDLVAVATFGLAGVKIGDVIRVSLTIIAPSRAML